MMDARIEHEERGQRGAFFIEENGRRIAEMTYSRTSGSLITIDNTEVDRAHAGKGIGRSLLDAAVDWARDNGTKVNATCPFVLAQFKKDSSIRDVLA